MSSPLPRKLNTPNRKLSGPLKLLLLPLLASLAFAESPAKGPVTVRVVASNLTSGNHQSYSPDNGNHSNPEGAGARILIGLKPDIVLIQEFNTTTPVRQWVNDTFGKTFAFTQEEGPGIPNGIISRFPIVESGEWDDAGQTNRDFVWAKLRLPNGKVLWAISVHLSAKKPTNRAEESRQLLTYFRGKIPAEDPVVLGGDFNAASEDDAVFPPLHEAFPLPQHVPADSNGIVNTNAPRNKPYDWVLADAQLQPLAIPVEIGGKTFPNGLVFDSRVFTPLDALKPIQPTDSAAPNMQHMAVVRDFRIP